MSSPSNQRFSPFEQCQIFQMENRFQNREQIGWNGIHQFRRTSKQIKNFSFMVYIVFTTSYTVRLLLQSPCLFCCIRQTRPHCLPTRLIQHKESNRWVISNSFAPLTIHCYTSCFCKWYFSSWSHLQRLYRCVCLCVWGWLVVK